MNKFVSALIIALSVVYVGVAQASEPEAGFSVPAIGAVHVLPEVEAKMREIEKRQETLAPTIESSVDQQAAEVETTQESSQYLASSY